MRFVKYEEWLEEFLTNWIALCHHYHKPQEPESLHDDLKLPNTRKSLLHYPTTIALVTRLPSPCLYPGPSRGGVVQEDVNNVHSQRQGPAATQSRQYGQAKVNSSTVQLCT